MINTILFDLDGTLLAFDQNEFIKLYFAGIEEKFLHHGYPKGVVLNAVFEGVKAMLANDGSISNEQAFWDRFSVFLPDQLYFFEKEFLDYYQTDFNEIKKIVKENEYDHKAIKVLKEKNYQLVLATNPLFPQVATYNRIKWGDLNKNDFSLITTFENSSFCKPNPKYYLEILEKINKNPNECMMVGNDVEEDLVAAKLGIDTYLITDNIINSQNLDYSMHKNGSFKDFYEFTLTLKDL